MTHQKIGNAILFYFIISLILSPSGAMSHKRYLYSSRTKCYVLGTGLMMLIIHLVIYLVKNKSSCQNYARKKTYFLLYFCTTNFSDTFSFYLIQLVIYNLARLLLPNIFTINNNKTDKKYTYS